MILGIYAFIRIKKITGNKKAKNILKIIKLKTQREYTSAKSLYLKIHTANSKLWQRKIYYHLLIEKN